MAKPNAGGMLPCPFCGNTKGYMMRESNLFFANCPGCAATSMFSADPVKAKKAWNRRHAPAVGGLHPAARAMERIRAAIPPTLGPAASSDWVENHHDPVVVAQHVEAICAENPYRMPDLDRAIGRAAEAAASDE